MQIIKQNDIIQHFIFSLINPSGMHHKDIATGKRITLQLYATQEKYETYKRATAITPQMYKNDLLFYSDSVQERHERNKKQITLLIQAIREKKIVSDMLEYNTTNTFYPSYVLFHHFNQFLKLAAGLAENNSALRGLLPKLRDGTAVGAIFDKMINTQFKKDTSVVLDNGVIKMPTDSYFYSFKTSPYIHICCFQVKQNNKTLYIFVQLRNQNSQFCEGVEVRDLGATLSPDYLTVAYRFNNIKPLFVVETENGKLYRNITNYDSVVQLGYSLQDLANSLYVTVKYTNMRLQFATYEKGKAERPIGQYQAVTSRIADGFATLFGLCFLRQRLITMPEVSAFMRYYLPFMHQVILQRLIDLRQCCGGQGYLQISGHPGFLERVSLRSAQPALTFVPDNKQIMKRVHYYSNDDDRIYDYAKQISPNAEKFSDIFYCFVMICIRMRQNRNQLSPRAYMKEFLRQSCIQMMYSTTYFDKEDPTNPTQYLLPYIIVKYVQQWGKFLDWNLMKIDQEKFNEILVNKKTEILNKITPQIPRLAEVMEIGFLRNIVLGEVDANQFYNKVMEAASKNNRRNSSQYKQEALKNLKHLIKEQRAKL